MPYQKTTWVSGTTPASATNMNNLESQFAAAMASFNQDFLTPYVLSGLAAVKDVTTATKLNVVAGVAYLRQSDNTLNRVAPVATNFTTSVISTTYYLDLNPDGTWSWSTSHSAQANYLSIAQVTTDASANILSVTDKRSFVSLQFSGAKSGPSLQTPISATLTQNASLAAAVTGGVTFGQAGSLPNSVDGAALFNGTTGYLSFPTSGLPTGNAAWSISARFKTSYIGGSQVILFAGAPAAKSAMWLYLDSAGHAILDLYSSSIASSVTGLNNGAWHSVTATWDGTNATLYVDGTQVGTSATLGPDNISYTYGLIGVYNTGSALSAYFNGTLDEVAVYGAALTSANVTTLQNAATSLTNDAYAATVLGFAPLRYYRLGDAAGATYATDTQSPTAQQIVNADGSISVPVQAATGVAQWHPVDSGGVVYDNITAPDGAARSRMLRANDGSNNQVSCLSLNTDGSITPQNAIRGVGGQASAGSFGVPVIVAQLALQPVTSTSTYTFTYTSPPPGVYRITPTFRIGNAAGGTITLIVGWVDDAAATNFADFTVSSNSHKVAQCNAAALGAGSYAGEPLMIYAINTGGHNIVVNYTNATATVNDVLSVLIERLA